MENDSHQIYLTKNDRVPGGSIRVGKKAVLINEKITGIPKP